MVSEGTFDLEGGERTDDVDSCADPRPDIELVREVQVKVTTSQFLLG